MFSLTVSFSTHKKVSVQILNKNTRTLGAGNYPAFEFILKVHGKVNFLSFTIKSL